MPEDPAFSTPIANKLAAQLGEQNNLRRDDKFDYVAAFGLTQANVAELIDLAVRWADEDANMPEQAPTIAVHAWRALGQLRAVEAVPPLLSVLNVLAKMEDGWSLDDVPLVFGEIGPAAIPPLRDFLLDEANRTHARVGAAEGLHEIAKRHPDSRLDVVQALVQQLSRLEPESYALNAACVCSLAGLRAVEAAEPIERALSAGVVDEGWCGGWDQIKRKLKVQGLGLPQPEKPYNSLRRFQEQIAEASTRIKKFDRHQRRKNLPSILKRHRKKRK